MEKEDKEEINQETEVKEEEKEDEVKEEKKEIEDLPDLNDIEMEKAPNGSKLRSSVPKKVYNMM